MRKSGRVGAGQPSAILSDDLPPGLIDPEALDLWRLYMDPTPGRDLWVGQVRRDMEKTHHRRPSLPPMREIQDSVRDITPPKHCLTFTSD